MMTGCAANRPIPSRPATKPVVREKAPSPDKSRAAERLEQKPAAKVQPPPKKEAEPVMPPKTPSPRAVAAVTLSDQGKTLLERKRPDEAIRVLERAVNLHPQNGENYYYLAEAWLLKGNALQAAEFNHLATIYLKDEASWQQKIASQVARIKATSKGN
ncbi:MAG: tetratricopeptide repeat protein [Desulfobacterales bacterium]|nr:tetratricopeptide repeat protein [Desulfobacterales bacterium]